MREILEAGFIFWGLFLSFGFIVIAYLVWMWWEEGRDAGAEEERRDAGAEEEAP